MFLLSLLEAADVRQMLDVSTPGGQDLLIIH